MASEIDWAWLAGVFEGEGTIVFTSKNSVAMRVLMTDEDVIRRLHRIAGVGQIGPVAWGQSKTLWRWAVQRKETVLDILDHIEPFLGERRLARAGEARERLAKCQPGGVPREKCLKGLHAMAGGNLYVNPSNGERRCRACQRARAGVRRARF